MSGAFMCKVTEAPKIDHVVRIVRKAFGASNAIHIPVDNPVSMDRTNMHLLQQQRYVVSFKADGTRYVLVLCMYKARPLACMVDRAGNVFALYVTAPATHFVNTSVFDGELCACVSGHNTFDFVVFNALIDQGAALHDKPYIMRLQHVRNNFSAEPVPADRRSRFQSFIFPNSRRLNILRKECEMAENTRALLLNTVPRYKYDGVVFTPADCSVVPGRDEQMLKHKTDNPIDVLLVMRDGVNSEMFVDNNGELVRLADAVGMPITFDPSRSELFRDIVDGAQVYAREFRENRLFEHVVEMDCAVNNGALELRFIRLRPDKDGPNNTTTVLRTLQTIRDNIQLSEIYELVSVRKPRMPGQQTL